MYIVECLEDCEKIKNFIEKIEVDKVYPESILEKKQQGEIFVDDLNNPKVALFWHFCGFAYIAGNYDENFILDIVKMMRVPGENHSNRLAIQTGNDDVIEKLLLSHTGVYEQKQYLFDYKGKKQIYTLLKKGFEIVKINSENYELISGRIIPAFSWKSRELFFEKGFGYAVFLHKTFVSCAFSSGISEKYVDIGVETVKQFKGQGFGKIVTCTMIDEILKRGKIPVWECNTTNEASLKLALSVGFEIKGVHPLYMFSNSNL